ncbi:putative TLC domain [Monocercomonoides exilis]|uniref:putative TLC domain n=1 Tax=Monocercomonoides exilis TaxID=2049356 RepID=UPI003559527B|nr:putative TLC domain [Monocercomonoides exilis]|eukprot:MONOS_11120.1-p1 / transcript=MONOS_11120.1 / gene=MONOS_11120 / organism=Monocercomonoides_exilis_PA203 / gene_product=unspecified product / transcript_product=unspecified product / location=Mono_scaffold00540:28533-29416(-) / protein_length=257 / sequence_SO=supercontig / SO=protein_coding / is_pseudo=false
MEFETDLFYVTFFAFIFYSCIIGISYWISKKYIKTFQKLDNVDKMNWVADTSATTHAIVATLMAFYILKNFGKQMWIEGCGPSPCVVKVAMAQSLGYFIEDTLLFLPFLTTPKSGGITILLHHLVCLLYTTFFIFTGYAPLQTTGILLTEFSTPFLHIRWYMKKYNMEESLAYVVNGAILCITYFTFRVLWTSFLVIHIVLYRSQIYDLKVHGLFSVAVGQLTYWMLYILDFGWCIAIIRAFFYRLGKYRSSHKKQN